MKLSNLKINTCKVQIFARITQGPTNNAPLRSPPNEWTTCYAHSAFSEYQNDTMQLLCIYFLPSTLPTPIFFLLILSQKLNSHSRSINSVSLEANLIQPRINISNSFSTVTHSSHMRCILIKIKSMHKFQHFCDLIKTKRDSKIPINHWLLRTNEGRSN